MENVVRVFNSFAEADAADALALARMTPAERVEIFFAIRERARNGAVDLRLERVCRVVGLEES